MDKVSERLPRQERIAKRREFLTVYENGKKIHSRSFVLYTLANNLGFHRLGVTVSKRVGKAVVRNRVKRQLREVFRRNKPTISPPMDLVINARQRIEQLEFSALRDEFISAIGRLRNAG